MVNVPPVESKLPLIVSVSVPVSVQVPFKSSPPVPTVTLPPGVKGSPVGMKSSLPASMESVSGVASVAVKSMSAESLSLS